MTTIQAYLTKPQFRTKMQAPILQLVGFCVGFLFAQAVVFDATVPLFVPFYIACARYDRSYKQAILAGGVLGAFTLGIGHVVLILLQILVFGLLHSKILKGYAVAAIMLSTALVQLVWQELYYIFEVPPLVFLYVGFEIVATGVIFLFCRQLFISPKKLLIDWHYERMISAIVLFSLLLISLTHLQLFNIAPATLLLQFAICCAAYYGSVSFAAFVATIVSVTISMAQLSFSGMIALYAVTGVVVGNAKRLGKYGIALLSIVPSVVFFLYDATLPLDAVHFLSISLGALLFLHVATFIRFNREEVQQEVQLVEQSLDDFKRFNVFLQQMVELSVSGRQQQKIELTNFTVCHHCYRFERCWSGPYMELKLKDLLKARQFKNEAAYMKAEQAIQESCIRSVYLQQELQHRIMQFNVANQQFYSRKLIGHELQQMGQHFETLLQHSLTVGKDKQQAEKRLRQHLGPSCVYVELEKIRAGYIVGTVNIVDKMDNEQLEERLTHFFNEQIAVIGQEDIHAIVPTRKYRFRSAIRYEMQYDIYNKTNADISGDHVVVTEIENGLQAILVADGMGSGKLAREQSKQLLFLLRQCMQYQLSPQLALLTLQYLLNPLSQDSYATLDMLLFDLKNGQMFAWKTGAMATYIVRGGKLLVVESSNAPLGTLEQATTAQKVQLFAGDYVFILTDGMFESDRYDEQERFLQHQLIESVRDDWSLSTVLYEIVEGYKARFAIQDDVTLIATKIEHLQYRWTTAKYTAK